MEAIIFVALQGSGLNDDERTLKSRFEEGKNREQSGLLGHYVNDRPYVASSFLSVAIAQVFGSAMAGRCKDREELVETPIPLNARIEVLPVRGGDGLVQRIFEPLGYTVEALRHPLDERFPEWGESPYYSVAIHGTKTLSDLLTHLYSTCPRPFALITLPKSTSLACGIED